MKYLTAILGLLAFTAAPGADVSLPMGVDTRTRGETWVEVRAHNAYGWSKPSARLT